MASFNRVILVGNLTRDIELKYTQGGTAVTELGMAVNDRRKTQSGEWIEETTFVDVTLWGRTAEVASEYLSKGAPVLIEGRLKLDTWETEGKKNYKLRVVGERMQMLGGRGGSGGGGGGGRPARQFDESEYSTANSTEGAGPSAGPAQGGGDEIPF
jgi:single-strand DNA-binding protein